MSDRIEVIPLHGYDRRARTLFTPVERTRAEVEIAENPEAWPVIPGTGGARKARAARGNNAEKNQIRDLIEELEAEG